MAWGRQQRIYVVKKRIKREISFGIGNRFATFVMKTTELIKLLRENGCYLVKHGANHDIWYSPITKKTFLVGRHPGQEIKKGTASAILKRTGIEI